MSQKKNVNRITIRSNWRPVWKLVCYLHASQARFSLLTIVHLCMKNEALFPAWVAAAQQDGDEHAESPLICPQSAPSCCCHSHSRDGEPWIQMAAAFLAALILPSPSAAQGSRAGEQPARTGPGRALSPTATCVPRFAAQLRLGPAAHAKSLQPQARQRQAARSWAGSRLLLDGLQEADSELGRVFLALFPAWIRSWLCSDQPCWGGQPLTAAPQLWTAPVGVGCGVLGTRCVLSIAHLPPEACWRGALVALTEAKGLQAISGCHWDGQGQSF